MKSKGIHKTTVSTSWVLSILFHTITLWCCLILQTNSKSINRKDVVHIDIQLVDKQALQEKSSPVQTVKSSVKNKPSTAKKVFLHEKNMHVEKALPKHSVKKATKSIVIKKPKSTQALKKTNAKLSMKNQVGSTTKSKKKVINNILQTKKLKQDEIIKAQMKEKLILETLTKQKELKEKQEQQDNIDLQEATRILLDHLSN